MKKYISSLLILLLIFLSSCTTKEYRQRYVHLNEPFVEDHFVKEGDYFLVFLVDARHLDYSDSKQLVKSLAKNPVSRRKGLDVGHAWVFLQGKKDGKNYFVEGGHSGEWGVIQPKYFQGVMNYIDYGYANPSVEQKKRPRVEENPIKYLWASLYDGEFQQGSGGHKPTFAARIELDEQQFHLIEYFMLSSQYNYRDYSMTRNQCSSFLAQIATLVDLDLEEEVTVDIVPVMTFGGRVLPLWKDPAYSKITFSSPDIIERSLMRAVREGRAKYALPWYKESVL
ncbi:MAG: hypothetical protein ACI9S8_002243 [Chlamydiales bacterium]|jgi:hypothetical protein